MSFLRFGLVFSSSSLVYCLKKTRKTSSFEIPTTKKKKENEEEENRNFKEIKKITIRKSACYTASAEVHTSLSMFFLGFFYFFCLLYYFLFYFISFLLFCSINIFRNKFILLLTKITTQQQKIFEKKTNRTKTQGSTNYNWKQRRTQKNKTDFVNTHTHTHSNKATPKKVARKNKSTTNKKSVLKHKKQRRTHRTREKSKKWNSYTIRRVAAFI